VTLSIESFLYWIFLMMTAFSFRQHLCHDAVDFVIVWWHITKNSFGGIRRWMAI